jgi:hypothetical protein
MAASVLANKAPQASGVSQRRGGEFDFIEDRRAAASG